MFRGSKSKNEDLAAAFESVSTLQEVKGLEKLGYKPEFKNLFLTDNMKTITTKNEDAISYLLKKYFNPKTDLEYVDHAPYLIELFKEACIKNMTDVAKTLLGFDIISDEKLYTIAANVKAPEMIHLLHESGIDFNKNNLGKKIVQIELSLFIFFANRDMINKDRMNTINSLLDCGLKITEADLPMLEEWDNDLLPRIRDTFLSRLAKIKHQIDDSRPAVDVKHEHHIRSVSSPTSSGVANFFEEKKEQHKRSQTQQVQVPAKSNRKA